MIAAILTACGIYAFILAVVSLTALIERGAR